MEISDDRAVRLVRCPTCHSVLEEPGAPVYQCGGCGTSLRGEGATTLSASRKGRDHQSANRDGSENCEARVAQPPSSDQEEPPAPTKSTQAAAAQSARDGEDTAAATAGGKVPELVAENLPAAKEAKQRLPPRNHCRPVLNGAPFVICSSCFKLVQLPADFALSTNTVRKLGCGYCSAILSYYYRDPATKKAYQDSIDQLSTDTPELQVDAAPLLLEVLEEPGAPRGGGSTLKEIQSEGTQMSLGSIAAWDFVFSLPNPFTCQKRYQTHRSVTANELGWSPKSRFEEGNRLRGFHQPETWTKDLKSDASEVKNLVTRQGLDTDTWRSKLIADYSFYPMHKYSYSQVEKSQSTFCKDLKTWVTMENRRREGLHHHACVQQVGHKLLGRNGMKHMIIEKVLLDRNGASNCTVISIHAESGHGKTSLLHALHNDKQLMDTFDKRIWIQLSDESDILMLFRKIVEVATNAHCSIENLEYLQEMVKEEITDKKFLLFLDDVDIEDQQFWSTVLEVLRTGAKGSAVIMATRSSTVSTTVSNFDVATHSCFLNPLSEKYNLMLLQQCAVVGTDIQSNPDLLLVSQRIISRSGGNPMKLKAIGGLLCHADSISLELDKFEGTVTPLQLCHDVLPIHMKKCLALCSLFPKGYIFDKHHMVLQWISHGCVRPAEGGELEDVGVEYFDELLCRSFFQYSPLHNDKDDKFVVHELVYKVLESVSRDRYFKSEDLLSSIPANILHLSLVSSRFQTVEIVSKTEELNDLQTFMLVQPEWKPYKIPFPMLNLVGLDDFFLKFTSLEILDLSHTDTEELPGSIGGLRNLQYLSVNNTSIRTLPPELCSLSNLQTLEAKDCRFLTELPGDTKKLLKLRHLDVTKELDYVHMPHGIGHLYELRTLPVFHESSDPSHCSVSELGNLHNLRGCLRVSGLESVKTVSKAQEANLKDKHHLKDLTLQWHDGGINTGDEDEDENAENVAEQVLERLQPHTNLQELAIRGYEGGAFPSWMQSSSSLPNLVSLTLDGCCNCTQFPTITHLPSLKFLSVRKMYDVKKLTSTIHGETKFPSLELLNLWEMYGLEELFEASEGDCPRLRKICVSRCPDLKRLPRVPSLAELVLHCGGRQIPDIPELASLVSLKIEGFHGVRSFGLPAAAALAALKKLEIRSCRELSSVDGLSALTMVQRLKVAGCPKLVLAKNQEPDE